jgi:hypothetical protein
MKAEASTLQDFRGLKRVKKSESNPTLCVRSQICESTLVSGTQRMGHPRYGGGKKQLRKPGPPGAGLRRKEEFFESSLTARLRSPRFTALISC